jgi:hypothetical protein
VAKNEDGLVRTRATLLGRMKNLDDQASWQEFFEIYWRLIYGFARKAGLNDAEAQDVVQETMVAVSKQMPRFTYDPAVGTFKATGSPTRKPPTGRRSGRRIGRKPY